MKKKHKNFILSFSSALCLSFIVYSCGQEVWIRSSSSSSSSSSSELDTTFGSSGKVVFDESGAAYAITTEGGDIMIAGHTGTDFFIAKLYADNGSLDTDFSSDGKLTVDVSSDDKAFSLYNQGSSYVLGRSNDNFTVLSINSFGALDSIFNSDGILSDNFSGSATSDNGTAISLIGDNIIVAGSSNNDFGLASYNNTGIVDSDFGSTTDISGSSSNDKATAMTNYEVNEDGNLIRRIAVAGTSDNDFSVVLYYYDNGTLDLSFNNTGKVTTDISGSGSIDLASAITTVTESLVRSLIVAGTSNDNFTLVSYYADNGTLNENFGTNGIVNTSLSGISQANAIVSVLDGADSFLYVVGSVTVSSVKRFAIASYHSDNGSLNTGFSTDGILEIDISGSGQENIAHAVTSITNGADHELYIAGESNGKLVVTKIAL